jgi:hypothetical protein
MEASTKHSLQAYRSPEGSLKNAEQLTNNHLIISFNRGNCLSGLSGGNSKEMKRTGTNRSNGANELQRTTSSFQGSVSDAVRYSDRPGGAQKPLTASDLHKSKTLEERLKKAGKVNDASRA